MSSSSVVPKRPAGAGRFQDWMWPDPASNANNGTANCVSRAGVQRTCQTTTAGGGTNVAFELDNETAQMVRCFAAADLAARMFDGVYNPDWRSFKSSRIDGGDCACWRMWAVMASSGLFPADNTTRDFGFELVRAPTAFMLKDTNDGIGFRIIDATHTELIVRGPNGLQRVSFALNDTTKFHKYELRIVGATNSLDAQLKVFIDDVQQPLAAAFSSWSGATNLPRPRWIGGRMNFFPAVINYSGNGADNTLFVKEVRLIAAPSEADCL